MFGISSRHYLHNWFLHSAIGPLITDFKRWKIYCGTFTSELSLETNIIMALHPSDINSIIR
jgi:hypothetical protein